MKGQKEGASGPKRKIADEILVQIGNSVLIVFLVVAVVTILMVRSEIFSSKKKELSLESRSAVHELSGFLEKYGKVSQQLAVNPDIRSVLQETGPGSSILEHEKMDSVREYLLNVVGTDPDNFMATWIADMDTSVITQSDNFTSDETWVFEERIWYPCVE